MIKLKNKKKGFTLVELIVVIAIMAILASIAAGVTVSVLNSTKKNAAFTEVNNVVNAAASNYNNKLAANEENESVINKAKLQEYLTGALGGNDKVGDFSLKVVKVGDVVTIKAWPVAYNDAGSNEPSTEDQKKSVTYNIDQATDIAADLNGILKFTVSTKTLAPL